MTLTGNNGFAVNGIDAGDLSGRALSAAGDVNGDGFEDFLIGAQKGDFGATDSGEAYLVFGGASVGSGGSLNLSTLDGTNGYLIGSIDASDLAGRSLGGGGDLNGDGFADIIVGAVISGSPSSGEVFVVFGGSHLSSLDGNNDGSIDLASVSGGDGSHGFLVNSGASGDNLALNAGSIAVIDDINGDGFDDLVIGARRASSSGLNREGKSYVVFGKADGFAATLDVDNLNGTNGFVLNGIDLSDYSGESVSSAGDFNGDGIGDMLIGAFLADPVSSLEGEAYLVFGGTNVGSSGSLDFSDLNGTNGFVIEGADASGRAGQRVAPAGDLNGDGYADVVIGAPEAEPGATANVGEAYIVFGGASVGSSGSLGVASLNGTNGFKVSGLQTDGDVGGSLSSGDINGDGFDDLLVGTYRLEGGTANGNIHVLFGGSNMGSTGSIDLSNLDAATGFTTTNLSVDGSYGVFGGVISSTGDINGDGFEDFAVGAPTTDIGGNSDVGISYVIFGGNFTNSVTHQAVSSGGSLSGTSGADVMIGSISADQLTGAGGADVLYGGAGIDSLYISDSIFLRVDGGSGYDSLRLDGAGFTLDLTTIADTRVRGIEEINLTGSGDNTLTLDLAEVLGLSDTSNTLTVSGNAGDTVNVGSGWFWSGTTTIGGEDYIRYSQGQATLLVDADITQTGVTQASSLSLGDLNGANGFRLDGIDANDFSGYSVSTAGDVNGDGFADLIIGAKGGNDSIGESFVVFGQASGWTSSLALSTLDGSTGFRIDGAAASDQAGASVSAAGDVNGDGFGDLIIGAWAADTPGSTSGESYVVFGKASGWGSNLALSSLDGSTGFRLPGIDTSDRSGFSVSGAGDVNGDGFDDVVIGAWVGNNYAGESYVVFGQSSGWASSVAFTSLDGSTGFRLDGDANTFSGISVSGAGDVNGDGFDDLIIGAENTATQTGTSYVVFGQASGWTSSLALTSLDGTTGFRLEGLRPQPRPDRDRRHQGAGHRGHRHHGLGQQHADAGSGRSAQHLRQLEHATHCRQRRRHGERRFGLVLERHHGYRWPALHALQQRPGDTVH